MTQNKCKGKKANGDPCQVTVGLDENGYCWRCKIQFEESSKSEVLSSKLEEPEQMAAGVTQTMDKDGKVIHTEYGEGPPAEEFQPVSKIDKVGREMESANPPGPNLYDAATKKIAKKIEDEIKDKVVESYKKEPNPESSPPEPQISQLKPPKEPLPSKTLFWDKKKKLPKTYDRRLYPCHECRRVRLNNGGQAVGVKSKSQGMVYLYCRECGATMAVPQDEEAMARKYTFEKKPPCTHCSSEDTKAYKTAGPVQYRVCNECKRTYPNRAIDPLSVERRSTIENIIRKCIQLEDTLSDKILEFIDTFYKNGKDGGDIWNDIRIRLNDLPDENIKNINSILEKEKKIISAPELRNFIREILTEKASEAI